MLIILKNVDRVLMSAQVALAGLFPPADDAVWNDHFDWQPIPVHTLNLADDYLVAAEKRCDHFDYIMLNYLNETAYKTVFGNYERLISYLEMKSGTKLPTLTSINNLYDTLLIEQLKDKW